MTEANIIPRLDQTSPSGVCSEIVRRVIRQMKSSKIEASLDSGTDDASPEMPLMIYFKEEEIDALLSGEILTATIHLLSFPTQADDKSRSSTRG
jgi:hypothetical protein